MSPKPPGTHPVYDGNYGYPLYYAKCRDDCPGQEHEIIDGYLHTSLPLQPGDAA